MPGKRRSLPDAKVQATLDLPLLAESGPLNVEISLDDPKQPASTDVANQEAQKSDEPRKDLRSREWTLVRVIEELADATSARLTRRVIAGLRRTPGMQREAGWRLATAWDEVCVQMQTEESFYWELAYIPTIEQLIKVRVENLTEYEKRAIWLQTNEGSDWLSDLDCAEGGVTDGYDYAGIPYDEETVVALILGNVLTEAANYGNARIRSYIDEFHGAG